MDPANNPRLREAPDENVLKEAKQSMGIGIGAAVFGLWWMFQGFCYPFLGRERGDPPIMGGFAVLIGLAGLVAFVWGVGAIKEARALRRYVRERNREREGVMR